MFTLLSDLKWSQVFPSDGTEGGGHKSTVGASQCQGGLLGHEIKKKMQHDTRKINRDEGLPALV